MAATIPDPVDVYNMFRFLTQMLNTSGQPPPGLTSPIFANGRPAVVIVPPVRIRTRINALDATGGTSFFCYQDKAFDGAGIRATHQMLSLDPSVAQRVQTVRDEIERILTTEVNPFLGSALALSPIGPHKESRDGAWAYLRWNKSRYCPATVSAAVMLAFWRAMNMEACGFFALPSGGIMPPSTLPPKIGDLEAQEASGEAHESPLDAETV